jgi:hypothetical protein
MFFANPSRFMKPGSTATVTIGAFSVSRIPVTDDAVAGSPVREGTSGPAPREAGDRS